MRTSDLSAEELALIAAMHERGEPANRIAHEVKRDRRTVRSALKRMGYELKRGRPAKPPPEPILGQFEIPPDRAGTARARLWDVLMDPASPGQAVVQSFNALAESEGWAIAPPKPLPEPANDAEVIERVVELIHSYPEPMQRAIIERLSA